jgi:hypothetical protein
LLGAGGAAALDATGGVCNHFRNCLRVRLIYRVARAFDLDGLALGPRVIPALEIRIDDLIGTSDDSNSRPPAPLLLKQEENRPVPGDDTPEPYGSLRKGLIARAGEMPLRRVMSEAKF